MSPLDTKALHKIRDLQHLLTIVLVRRNHLRLLTNHFHSSKLFGRNC